MAVMKATDFVSKAKAVAKNYKTLYIMGCFGAPMNNTNKTRYCKNHVYNKQAARTKKIKAASADTFGFDCVNLLKGLLWGWNGNKNATYGGAKYASNGVPDTNANGMFDSCCTDKSTNFKNIVPGEFVWMSGHIGVYIGDGLAVECTPIWKDGVQITAVGNIGKKAGYNTRTWTKHGKCKFLSYSAPAPTPAPSKEPFPGVSDEELARRVWAGEFGSGDTRKKKLGSRYKAVQALVNKGVGKNTSSSTTYLVKKGDTLSSIAKKFGTTYQKIAKDNKLANPNWIYPGQKLIIKK